MFLVCLMYQHYGDYNNMFVNIYSELFKSILVYFKNVANHVAYYFLLSLSHHYGDYNNILANIYSELFKSNPVHFKKVANHVAYYFLLPLS